MTENHRILIVDDERPILLTLEALLGRHGYQTETAATAAAGLRALKNKPASLVLLDLQLPDAEGLEMLKKIKSSHPETQVVILTAHDTLSNAIESIKRGAYHFISKPYAPEELLSLVEKALEKQSLLRETDELRQKTQQLEKSFPRRSSCRRHCNKASAAPRRHKACKVSMTSSGARSCRRSRNVTATKRRRRNCSEFSDRPSITS